MWQKSVVWAFVTLVGAGLIGSIVVLRMRGAPSAPPVPEGAAQSAEVVAPRLVPTPAANSPAPAGATSGEPAPGVRETPPKLPGPDAGVDAWVTRLKQMDRPKKRREIMETLAARNDETSIRVLLALTDGLGPDVCGAAAKALGELDTPAARDVLRREDCGGPERGKRGSAPSREWQ